MNRALTPSRPRLWLCLLALLGACEGAVSAVEGADVPSGEGDSAGPGAPPAPQGEVAAPDLAGSPEAGSILGFELGVNVTGQNQPKYYAPLDDGCELTIEYGPQGLWMVVLAFRTKGLLQAPLALDGSVWLGDTLLGQLKLAGQPIFPGPEGYGYYYNFYLVVDVGLVPGPGQIAAVIFRAVDAEGDDVEIVRRVVLVGGPGGDA